MGVVSCCVIGAPAGARPRSVPDAGLSRLRGGSLRRLSWSAWLYIALVVAAALGAIVRGPLSGVNWYTLSVLALLYLVCDSTSAPLMPRRAAWSPSTSATLASVVLLGPVGAVIIGFIAALSVRRGLLVAQRLFNGGMFSLSAYAAGWTFVMLHGHVGIPGRSFFPAIIAPFAAAAAVHVIVNHVLLAGVLWLTPSEAGAGRKMKI